MRRLIFILLILPGLMVMAQEEEFKTIFGSDYSSGGYGAPELKLGNVNHNMSLLLGGRGGWIIGHRFVLGGAGYGLTTSNTFDYTEKLYNANGSLIDSTRNLRLDMGYGGVLLEYIAFPKKAIHLSFPLIIGAGGASIGSQINQDPNQLDPVEWTTYDYVESSAFFIVEPGISLEMNMTKFFRLNLGATYRFISGTTLQRMDSNDLSDLSFSLALKFGAF
ncbi:MAG: hypothetical protein KQI35_08555 [Bacteroidetes bacterium]|nr:hypothetical protein [Bacteroidota bacterium]